MAVPFMKMPEFKFLTDQPLEADKELDAAKFGHEDIGETLAAIISKCGTPFSIALSGRWGSGKSSIANLVIKKLKQGNEIAIVYFDVWKYEGDALRRSFLKEAEKQLKKSGELAADFKLNDRLDNSVSVKGEATIGIQTGILKQLLKPALIGLLIIAATTFILYLAGLIGPYIEVWEKVIKFTGGVVGVTTLSSALTLFFVKIIPKMITTETKTFATDRFKDPHEFENEFENLLNGLTQRRLLVIFDNLDRITHDKALEVLSTIKTFLEPKDVENLNKEVVFLIPCDIEAIKEHIRHVYKQSGSRAGAFDEDEFLKKFFNTIVEIPNFISTELEDYAQELLKETRVPTLDNGRVAWLIAAVFRENPRQIKQFINSLLSAHILVEERKKRSKLATQDIEITQLAKFLILESNFPRAIQKLKEAKEWDLSEFDSNVIDGLDERHEFQRFIDSTSHIPIRNLSIFLTLRHSAQEQKLPGFEAFSVALKDKDQESAEKFIDSIQNFEQSKTDLTQAIKEIWDKTRNEDSKFSILATILPILHKKALRLDVVIYDLFANFLTQSREYLKSISSKVIFKEILDSCGETYFKQISKSYIALLELQGSGQETDKLNPDFANELIGEIAKHTDRFSDNDYKIRDILVKYYPGLPNAIELFSSEGKVNKAFIGKDFITAFLANLKPDEFTPGHSDFHIKVSGLKLLDDSFWDKERVKLLADKLTELATLENTKEISKEQLEEEEDLTQLLNGLLRHMGKYLNIVKGSDVFDGLIRELTSAANAIPEIPQRKMYLPVLMTLRSFASESATSQCLSVINNFLIDSGVKKEDYDYLYEFDGDSLLIEEDAVYKKIEERAMSDVEIFLWLYDKLPDDRRTGILKLLIESSSGNFVKVADELKYNVPNSSVVVEGILNKLPKVKTAQSKLSLYQACNKFKCAESDSLENRFNQILSESIRSGDPELQKVGEQAFAEADYLGDKRRITVKEIIDWLRDSETDSNQPDAIKVVLDNWELLSEQQPKQKEFVQYVFDRLLGSSSADKINLGYQALQKIKPEYKEHTSLYRDLMIRIETENDENIKNILQTGFAVLKEIVGIPDKIQKVVKKEEVDGMEEKGKSSNDQLG